MNYAEIKKNDIANGTGIRVSLFVSGCDHHCKNCFNQETWDFNYGKEFTDDTMEEILKDLTPKHITGITLIGGEPLHPNNIETVNKVIHKVREVFGDEKDIWVYTGYTFEDLQFRATIRELIIYDLLKSIDVLVDGKFNEELKNLNIRFRGSTNQRIIDVKETIKNIVNSKPVAGPILYDLED